MPTERLSSETSGVEHACETALDPRSSTPPAIPPDGYAVPQLPVIRLRYFRRSFHLDRSTDGVAVYEDALVLLSAPRKCFIPETAFASGLSSSLNSVRGVKITRTIAWESIESLSVCRKKWMAIFKGTANGRRFSFTLKLVDARSVVESCKRILGDRYSSDLTPMDFFAREEPGKTGLIVAWILFLLIGGLMANSTLKALHGQAPSDLYQVYAGIGWLITLLSGFYIFADWLNRPSHRPAGVEPFRSRPLGLMMRVFGAGLFFLGWSYPEQLLIWLGWNTILEDSSLIQIAGLLVMYPGGLLLYVGNRLSARSGREVLEDDHRAPTLYLRSFGDDGQNNLNPDGLLAKALGIRPIPLLAKLGALAHLYPLRMLRLLFGVAADTAEEQIGSYFRKHGPFVAIGKPGEVMATTGADRLYVAHDEWQAHVLDLMERSWAVVLQPAATEGVWWEISKSFEKAGPRKLLLSLANFEEAPEAYDQFRLRFANLTGHPLPPTPGGSHFLRFDDDWTPHLLPSAMRSVFAWPVRATAIDMERTLHPFLDRVPNAPADISAPSPARPPSRSGLLGLFAIVCWNVLPLVLLIAVKSIHAELRAFGTQLSGPQQEIVNNDPVYRWHLGSDWTEQQLAGSDARIFLSKNQVVGAAIVASSVPGDESDLEAFAREHIEMVDNISAFKPVEASRQYKVQRGKTWLQIRLESTVFSEADQHADQMSETFGKLQASYGAQGKVPSHPRDALTPDQLAERLKSAVHVTWFMQFRTAPEGRYAVKLWTDSRALQIGLSTRDFERVLEDFQIDAPGKEQSKPSPTAVRSNQPVSPTVHPSSGPGQANSTSANYSQEALATPQSSDRALGLYWEGMPEGPIASLRTILERGEKVQCIAVQPGGGHVIVTETNIRWKGISDRLEEALKANLKNDIRLIAFSGQDQWALIYGNNGYQCSEVPENLRKGLQEINSANTVVRAFSVLPSSALFQGWFLVLNKNGYSSQNAPADMLSASKKAIEDGETINGAALSPSGGWILVRNGYGYSSAGLPRAMLDVLSTLNAEKRNILQVAFAGEHGWLVLAGAPAQVNFGPAIDQAEARLQAAYDALRSSLPPSRRNELKKEELNWINKKEALPPNSRERLLEIETRIAVLQARTQKR